MISVEKALDIIRAHAFVPATEHVALHQSAGRCLAENIYARESIPPFNRVMMDGIAIQRSHYEAGQRRFLIEGIQRAGEAQKKLSDGPVCLEVMTGAVCPENADCVIPYEQVRIEGDHALCTEIETRPMMHIHLAGSDKAAGDLMIASGKKIASPEIGILASHGYEYPAVASLPKAIIFSTGDELVDVAASPLPHQIRRSNAHVLRSILAGAGIQAQQEHLPDDAQAIRRGLEDALHHCDLILLSGGVSMGKFDLIPEVMRACGVTELFHRIAQKPGKPMWFGSKGNTRVFALPGNPVSTLLCATRYLTPWLHESTGEKHRRSWMVRLDKLPKIKGDLRHFVPARILFQGNEVCAHLLPWNGSGDYSALTDADVFVEIDPGNLHAEVFPAFPIRHLF